MQDKVKLLCDSQSASHLAKNPSYQSKTKRIPIKYHFVRLLNMPMNFPDLVDMSRFSGAYFVVVCSTKSTNLV
jgi:hypothetical protein